MLDLTDLAVFVRVAELGHFSHAAEALNLPKARVSQRIASLEATLGARLFQRTTRRVSLTPDGQALLGRAQALLGDAQELQAQFDERSELSGRLRVDMPVRLATDTVMPALPAFLAAHPRLDIELSSTDRRVDLVEDGFDCVLRVGTVNEPQLIVRQIGALVQLNLASPGYLSARGRPELPADLLTQGHRLVHYAQRQFEDLPQFEWLQDGALQTLALPASVRVSHTVAYEAAARAGLGLIQAPEIGTREAIRRGELVEILPAHRAPPLPVQLVYTQRRHQPRRVRVFMDWLANLIAEKLR